MAGPTDILTEDVKELRETNRELALEIKGVFERLSTEMRESNLRLTEAINSLARDFSNFRVEVAKEFGAVRAEMAKEFGAVRGEMEKEFGEVNARMEKEFGEVNARLDSTAITVRMLGRGVLLLFPVVVSLMGAAFGIAWYAGRLESRVERVEKAVGAMEHPGSARR